MTGNITQPQPGRIHQQWKNHIFWNARRWIDSTVKAVMLKIECQFFQSNGRHYLSGVGFPTIVWQFSLELANKTLTLTWGWPTRGSDLGYFEHTLSYSETLTTHQKLILCSRWPLVVYPLVRPETHSNLRKHCWCKSKTCQNFHWYLAFSFTFAWKSLPAQIVDFFTQFSTSVTPVTQDHLSKGNSLNRKWWNYGPWWLILVHWSSALMLLVLFKFLLANHLQLSLSG